MKEIDALTEINPQQDLPFVFEAIEKTRAGLPDHVSLIGFVGAPLTLAAYMIEGYPDKNWVHFKSMMYDAPDALDALLDKVATAVTAHARAQVEAGCDVIQVFDTNAGLLPPDCLEKFAFKYAERVIRGFQELGVPVVYFAKGISQHLDKAAKMKSDVLGVDWTISMKDARAKVGPDITLQGNLDPCALFASAEEVRKRVTAILEDMKDDPRFVFNLGHGDSTEDSTGERSRDSSYHSRLLRSELEWTRFGYGRRSVTKFESALAAPDISVCLYP